MEHELPIHEELLLLALRDEEGTIHTQASLFQYAIAGGVLAELLLVERIALEGETSRKHVRVVNPRPTGSPLTDACLRQIRDARRPRDLAGWVGHFARRCDLHHRVAADLCRRGVLRAHESTVLLIFTQRRYPELDHRYEQRVVTRLRDAVLHPTAPVDARTTALLALAEATKLLGIVFDKGTLKEHQDRIAALTRGDLVGQHALAVARAARDAVMITCAATTAAIVAATG